MFSRYSQWMNTYSKYFYLQANPRYASLVIEVGQSTFDESLICDWSGESSTASLIRPMTPSFYPSSASSDQSVSTTPTASSSVQKHKANNDSKKRKLQNSFERECLQSLKYFNQDSNTSTPDDLSSTFARTVEHWLRFSSAKGQKVASLRINQVLMDLLRKNMV